MYDVKLQLTVDGTAGPARTFGPLSVTELTHFANNMIDHALRKVTALAPDTKPTVANPHEVEFTYSAAFDDGTAAYDSTHSWHGVDDASVSAMRGLLDGAMAKLDKRIAAKAK